MLCQYENHENMTEGNGVLVLRIKTLLQITTDHQYSCRLQCMRSLQISSKAADYSVYSCRPIVKGDDHPFSVLNYVINIP